jgi:Ca-activated chloride channel family protein
MSRMALVAMGALIAVVAICDRVAVRSSIAKGNEALNSNDIQAAAALYQAALERRPSSGAASLGLGVAMYRQHRYEDAVRAFDRAERLLQAARDRARASFNRGNASAALGKLPDALEDYKAALRLDPSDEDARHNLAIVRQLLENERPERDRSMSRDSAEQLISALGRPKVKGPGRSEPFPARPAPGSSRQPVDK